MSCEIFSISPSPGWGWLGKCSRESWDGWGDRCQCGSCGLLCCLLSGACLLQDETGEINLFPGVGGVNVLVLDTRRPHGSAFGKIGSLSSFCPYMLESTGNRLLSNLSWQLTSGISRRQGRIIWLLTFYVAIRSSLYVIWFLSRCKNKIVNEVKHAIL